MLTLTKPLLVLPELCLIRQQQNEFAKGHVNFQIEIDIS